MVINLMAIKLIHEYKVSIKFPHYTQADKNR
jgi:hypothetical protein